MEYNIGQNPIFLAKCSIFSNNYKERPEKKYRQFLQFYFTKKST